MQCGFKHCLLTFGLFFFARFCLFWPLLAAFGRLLPTSGTFDCFWPLLAASSLEEAFKSCKPSSAAVAVLLTQGNGTWKAPWLQI